MIQCLGKGPKVLMKRLSTRDHNEGSTLVLSVKSLLCQRFHRNGGVLRRLPRVFRVTPWTTHLAARKTDKKGTASSMVPLALEGMERFHHREVLGVSH